MTAAQGSAAPHTALSAAYLEFSRRFPEYEKTRHIDELRAREFGRIEAWGWAYLDYTGAAPYSERLVEEHSTLLRSRMLGNPHSRSEPSMAASRLVEDAQDAVSDYFRAGPEYRVVFTNNASHAAKLVGESFPFSSTNGLLLTEDNHNSIVGISCFARRAVAPVDIAALDPATFEQDQDDLWRKLKSPSHRGLLALPAQSNFSGVKHSLDWLERARNEGWSSLLDAAAFLGTSELDLSRTQPDFVILSFYKMFGYPTGVGCLLARSDALNRLNRPWFAGGSVVSASPRLGLHRARTDEARFEEGTSNYTAIAAIPLGLRWLGRIIRDIQIRTSTLTSWLLEQLCSLRHLNGNPLVTIHGPRAATPRGSTVSMTLRDPAGVAWKAERVERLANEMQIAVRAGAHCNPGANEVATGVDRSALGRLYAETSNLPLDDFLWSHERVVRGVVRISLGSVSNFSDVWRFAEFLRGLLDREANR